MKTIACTLALFPALGGALAAQNPAFIDPGIRQGAFSAWPVGMSLSGDGDALWFARASQQVRPTPSEFTEGSSGPNYEVEAIFRHLTQSQRDDLEIDAVSSGNALLPQAAQWTDMGAAGFAPALQMERWLALTVSVTASSPTMMNPLFDGSDSGSDLVSYFFAESNGVPDRFLGQVHLEQSGDQIGLTPQQDLDAFDFALGMLMTSPEDALQAFAPVNDSLYFSVSNDYAAMHTGVGFAMDGPVSVAADGATIYRSTWIPASNAGPGGWSLPEVYIDKSALGLTGPSDDVDAITVDELTGVVIFSLRRLAYDLRDQLLVSLPDLVQTGMRRPPKPLLEASGTPVSVTLGISLDDDIDGACGTDPEIGMNLAGRGGGTPREEGWIDVFGTDPHYSGFDDPMGLSITRDVPSGAGIATTLRLQVSGWGRFAQPIDSVIVLNVATGSNVAPGGPLGAFETVVQLPRSAGQDLWHYELSYAPAALTRAVLGLRFAFEAVSFSTTHAIDLSTGLVVPINSPNSTPFIGATYPVEITL